eukprot:CAMPEP_0172199744 /NCGR_PEP_ID=MMETSP1050-20130122/28873_1 /TAXON_ID=233186 /ORGANISM="Cryptomonas curvata, Strain CCAP979/52" /LENGTH=139 /DNA_ID=CAMNT_0012876831 /DNA_START=87 /DNA_END=503 /DNA_ORIENTATION=+
MTTDQLLLRKVRVAGRSATRPAQWEIEVGESAEAAAAAALQEGAAIQASSDQPVCLRLDTRDLFQWRVRNVPYPADTYEVTADLERQEVVIRTKNKKYFKRLCVPDLRRAGAPLDEDLAARLSFAHANRTLVVSLPKPP